MRNNYKFKNYLIKSLVFSLIIIVLFLIISIYEYRIYNANFNNKINEIVNNVILKYPNVSEDEIMSIINSNNNEKGLLKKYSIDIYKDSLIIDNERYFKKFLLFNILLLVISFLTIIYIFIRHKRVNDKDINSITKLIEEINNRNYELNIDSISEDELSILKNEIYKTTIMLKEAADNSINDKINLKRSLEDISHQLKTPLTSILIMLDNIIDNGDMDSKVRDEFIIDIKRNVYNINFLVQAILKLSRFDSNTINYIRKETCIKEIIDSAILNVSSLCDLREVTISLRGDFKFNIYCDCNWQVEAITNILKNAVDHSKSDSEVIIECSQNSVYSCIKIIDYGDGISKKDINHIFDRFYRGENAREDSIGIGLALSKTIIEEDRGTIKVDSSKDTTIFTIKYFKL